MKRWFVNIGWVGVMAWQLASAEVHHSYSDHLGSTSVVTDASGAVIQIETYTPFGEILTPHLSSSPQRGEERGEGVTAYLYTGQELDRSSELYNYGARYYDPALSRFTSIDPVFDSPSPYAYVNNNPIRLIDPNGQIGISSNPSENWQFVLGYLAGSSPFFNPKTAPNDPAFLLGALGGSTARTAISALIAFTSGSASIGAPPTAVATVPLALASTGIAVDGATDVGELGNTLLGLVLTRGTENRSNNLSVTMKKVGDLSRANGMVRVRRSQGVAGPIDGLDFVFRALTDDIRSHEDLSESEWGPLSRRLPGETRVGMMMNENGRVSYLGSSSGGGTPAFEEAEVILNELHNMDMLDGRFVSVNYVGPDLNLHEISVGSYGIPLEDINWTYMSDN